MASAFLYTNCTITNSTLNIVGGGINVVNLSHSYSFLHSRKKFKKFNKNT